MTSRADRIANAVLTQFSQLPPKRKPSVRDNGLHEWVPLSGIVAERNGYYSCLALATGMKCLPAARIPSANGAVLHDWHAETLVARAFNRYLLDECTRMLTDGEDSQYVERNEENPRPGSTSTASRPFRVKSDVKIHLYCSEAPCGDASMELIMAAQDDATPWEAPTPAVAQSAEQSLAGREFFSRLGIVRRKPARRDAPPTLSKSCSDKIALKQCTSLLSSISSLFIEPQNAYIDTLVVPTSQYSKTGYERSFSSQGRLKSLQGRAWPGGYSFRPFNVETTDVEFPFSRKSLMQRGAKISPSSIGAAWSSSGCEETIVGGVLQGRKQSDVKGASRLSRRRMWIAARDLANQLGDGHSVIHSAVSQKVYADVKRNFLLANKQQVITSTRNEALGGWVQNQGDSDFRIEVES